MEQLALRGEAPCLSKGMESRLGAGYRRWQRLTLVPYSPYWGVRAVEEAVQSRGAVLC